MPAGATVYSFDTEEEMLLSFRHFVQDAPMDRLGESPVETFSKSQQRHKISEIRPNYLRSYRGLESLSSFL